MVIPIYIPIPTNGFFLKTYLHSFMPQQQKCVQEVKRLNKSLFDEASKF